MSVMQKDMVNVDDNMRMEWDPFSDTAAPSAPFFGGAGRADTIDQLQHLLRYGPSLTVLAGDPGVGKRTLINQFLRQLDRDLFDVADLNAGVMLSFQQLLTSLEEPWRSLHPITCDNYQELVPALASAADEESKTLVCILREAEKIDTETAVDLQSLLKSCAGLPLKFLLVANVAELERSPRLQMLVQALPDSSLLYLDPFTAAQTADYLQFRLQAAGLGAAPFSPQQVERIQQASDGKAGRINGVAQELLLDAMPTPAVPSRNITGRPQVPWLHVGAFAVVLAVLGLILFSGGEETPPAETAAGDNASRHIVLENAAQPVADAPQDNRFAEVGRVAEQSAPVEVAPAAATEPAALDVAVVPVDPAASAGVSAVEPVATVASPAATPAPAVTPVMPVPEPVVASAPVLAPAAVKPATPVPAKPAAAPKPAARPAAAVAPAVDSRSRWIMSLPRNHYVLQLLGANEESTVKRFLSQYPSLKKVSYYRTQRQGKPWYVVVQGDYPDYASAKRAVASLPAAIRQQTPWVRQVDAIRQELK